MKAKPRMLTTLQNLRAIKLSEGAGGRGVRTGCAGDVAPGSVDGISALQGHAAGPLDDDVAGLKGGLDRSGNLAGGGSTERGEVFVRTAAVAELDAADIGVGDVA